MNAASFNLVMLLLWAGTARAEDWQMFRGGPALLGVADGSLPTKPELLWSFKTGGAGESSPVVVGRRVFVGSTDAFLYALDAASGRLLWKYETGEKILGG